MFKVSHIVAGAALALSACAALAGPRETALFTNIDSGGTNYGVGVTHDFAGGFAAKYITVSGTLQSHASGTYALEAAIQVSAPNGVSFIIQPAQELNFTTLTVPEVTYKIPLDVPSAAGTWGFRCFETFQDASGAAPDATWTFLNIVLNDGAPASQDAGPIKGGETHVAAGSVAIGATHWMRFSIGLDAKTALGTYLDIDTEGTFVGDTMLALYRDDGTLVASDDDGGSDTNSQLTFGAGTRPAVGNGHTYDGRHGTLPAGVYYLAVTPYLANFGPTGWAVTGGSSSLSDVRVNFGTNTAAAVCPADLDDGTGSGTPDGGVTIDDLLFFLQRFSGGC